MDIVSFEKLLPPIEQIVEDFGIEPSVAFYLWRPVLGHKVRQYDVDLSIQIQKQKLLQNLSTNERPDSSTETPGSQSDASEMRDASAPTRDDPEPRQQNGAIEFAEVSEYVRPTLASCEDLMANSKAMAPRACYVHRKINTRDGEGRLGLHQVIDSLHSYFLMS